MSGYPETPECDKMTAARGQSEPAGEFLEWLGGEGFVLGRYDADGAFYEAFENTQALLARWLGIDLDKAEQERRAILEYIRSRS